MATVQDKVKSSSADKYDAYVEEQLTKARKRIRSLDLTVALLGFLVGTLIYTLIMVLLDRALDLSPLARLLALGLYSVGSAAYLAFALVLPLTRRLNPYYAAKQLEQTLPNSKNSVVNWLDLQERNLPTAIRGAVGHKAARDLAVADLEKAISGRRAAWLGGASGFVGFIMLITVVVVGIGPFFGFLGRAFFPFAEGAYPTRTRIVLLKPENGDATVTVGQPVAFVVRVDGRVPEVGQPDAVRLLFRYQQGEPYEERPFQHDSDRNWVASVPSFQVQNGFWYKVAGGDFETSEHRVTVRSTPLVHAFDVAFRYRPYFRFQDDQNKDPNLTAWRGTEVTLTAHTNRVVRTEDGKVNGQLALELKENERKSVAAEPVADDPQALRFKFVMEESGNYKLWFASAEGERNTEPMPYTITVLPDLAPTVILTRPGRDVMLPANGTLSLQGIVTDDVGVVGMTLRMKVDQGPELHPKPYREGKSFKLVDGTYPKELQYKDFVALAEVKSKTGLPFELKPGMVVEYWLEASDNCDFPAANVTASKHFKVTIVEPADPMAAQQEKQQAQNEQKEHEANQDQDLKQQNESREPPKDQEKPEQKNGANRDPNKPENKDPMKDPGMGDNPMNQEGDKGNEGNQDPNPKNRDDKAKEDLERLKNQADKDNKKGDAKDEPQDKDQGEAKDQNKGESKDRNKDQKQDGQKDEKGEKGECKDGKCENPSDKPGGGGGKGKGQQQGDQKQSDPGDAKGGGEQSKPEDRATPKGGGQQNKPEDKGEAKGDPKGDGNQQQKTERGPGQAGQPNEDEGTGKDAGQQQAGDPKAGSSKGGDQGELSRENNGQCKGGGNNPPDNRPKGDPKDDPKRLSRADNKDAGDKGQEGQKKPQQNNAKGGGKPQQGNDHKKGEGRFDEGDPMADKGNGKPDQKDGDGSGQGEKNDEVDRLKRKAKDKNTPAKERQEAKDKLENIEKNAGDAQTREEAKKANDEIGEQQRREAEAKPGEAKDGPEKGMDGMGGQKPEQPVAEGKGGDGKEEQQPQAGQSKGDQQGPPGKDKGQSKGVGEKVVEKPGPNGEKQPGGGSGGQGDRPPEGPPGAAKPAPEFAADPDAHKNAGDLQLENIKKVIEEVKKNPEKMDNVLKELKMTPERFKELEDYVNEKLPAAQQGTTLQGGGVKKVDQIQGQGTGVQAGGQGVVPPGYQDAFQKFSREVAKPDKP